MGYRIDLFLRISARVPRPPDPLAPVHRIAPRHLRREKHHGSRTMYKSKTLERCRQCPTRQSGSRTWEQASTSRRWRTRTSSATNTRAAGLLALVIRGAACSCVSRIRGSRSRCPVPASRRLRVEKKTKAALTGKRHAIGKRSSRPLKNPDQHWRSLVSDGGAVAVMRRTLSVAVFVRRAEP
jgi:hypothetical protein